MDRLLDAGTFTELGILGSEYAERPAPADGVVTGLGEIDGRKVCVAAYDYTVLGGSIGLVGETKVTRLRKLAVTCGVPMVWLVDSAGARIDPRPENLEKIPLFADSGHLFHEQVLMSGVVPQVAAMMGPGYAGTAYVPGLADFVPMVKGSSAMALGGPALVRAAVGEEVDEEELGGSAVHNRESGCADQEAESDEECLQMVRTYLSFFPSSCRTPPPRKPSAPGRGLLPDEVLDLLPDDPRRTWDVKRLLPLLADDGFFFELKPYYARSMVTALARVAGYPVGVVANNPRHLAGAIDSAAASKAARFVDLCDAFGIPLVFLVDVPGFLVGTHAERSGIIDRGSRMLYAVSRATVPKITVVLRRAYGAGYYVMCGRAFEPDLIVAWPGAEICVMGPEGMVSIAAGKLLAHHPEPDALRRQITDMLAGHMDIANIARRGFVDDIIDPRETRDVLITALETTRDKRLERPWRRHGIAP
ncbi:MAG: acyl-CoA carboxylase subunit beta [Sandaracinaceae bacterium]|nr:acyl-CoA carboxylase subunit beta [Sandaracinaceae bacterium]